MWRKQISQLTIFRYLRGFSDLSGISWISLLPEKNYKANPGLGNCRSLYVSIAEKIHIDDRILNEPRETLKKEEKKKRITGAKFIYTPKIRDVAVLTTPFYHLSVARNNAVLL